MDQATDDDNDDEGPIQSALKNALILCQIFTSISTRELISSCCLVNKDWNFQARTYVRNFRNDCQVYLSSISSAPTCVPCIKLQEFSDTVKNMTVVPFTSISIVKNRESRNDHDRECKGYSHSAAKIEDIVKRIKLKKLYIQLDDLDTISCAATQYFVFLLLRENSSQLQTLRIRCGVPTLLHNLVQSWAGELPELERIEWETSYNDLKRNKNFLETIFKGATKKLKILRLGPGCLFEALKMFPEDQYCRMLDRFDLDIRSEFKRRDQCLKVGRIGPALSELHIFDYHRDFKADLLTVLAQLLHSSQQSLQAVRIRHLERNVADLFTSIEWPTLKNVKNFQLETRGSAREWAAMLQQFIDYGRIFPALEIVTLDHTCGYDDEEYDALHELNPDAAVVTYSCPSVTTLQLSLDLGQVSLSQLKSIFPSIPL